MHESILRENYYYTSRGAMLDAEKLGPAKRSGMRMRIGRGLYLHQIFPCKDGYVTWVFFGGTPGAQDNRRISEWMDDEGIPGEIPKNIDWEAVSFNEVDQNFIDAMEGRVIKLFMKYNKYELEEEAMKRGIRVYAVNNIQDMINHLQLDYRKFYKNIYHSELETSIKYPGYMFQTTEGDKASIRHRAPLIGEHNEQIYGDLLGMSERKLTNLREIGVI
jgi:crotonobetainyl-CoA:carnitine CoA-transferase CaiB-like acyl-CoA transferase